MDKKYTAVRLNHKLTLYRLFAVIGGRKTLLGTIGIATLSIFFLLLLLNERIPIHRTLTLLYRTMLQLKKKNYDYKKRCAEKFKTASIGIADNNIFRKHGETCTLQII